MLKLLQRDVRIRGDRRFLPEMLVAGLLPGWSLDVLPQVFKVRYRFVHRSGIDPRDAVFRRVLRARLPRDDLVRRSEGRTSNSEVSRICKALDEDLKTLLDRSIGTTIMEPWTHNGQRHGRPDVS